MPSTAGTNSNFTAACPPPTLASFNAAFPNRIAFKHAHSQQNPEKDWGTDTLNAIRFAFYVLNEQFGSGIPTARPRSSSTPTTRSSSPRRSPTAAARRSPRSSRTPTA